MWNSVGIPLVLLKPQNNQDFTFSRHSAVTASEVDGISLPPHLKPEGIGAPLMGPDIFTLPLASNLSGEGTRSMGDVATGEEATGFRVG